MRNIFATFLQQGVSTKITLRKKPRERRFVIIVNGVNSEYGLSDETNELIHLEGPVLDPALFPQVNALIHQYFGKTRAIVKLNHDDFLDYDDV